jgi:hypothetical protein
MQQAGVHYPPVTRNELVVFNSVGFKVSVLQCQCLFTVQQSYKRFKVLLSAAAQGKEKGRQRCPTAHEWWFLARVRL